MATIEEQQALVKKMKQKFAGSRPVSVQALQAKLSIRAPAGARVWISQDVFTAPGNSNLSDVFYRVVEDMTPPGVEIPCRNQVKLGNVPVEWIGQRNQASSSDRQDSNLSEGQIYHRLCGETTSRTTVFYAHGGAFYAGSPTFSRAATTKLARFTKGRVASVAYRLAPQDPFPTALLDLMMAWLSLVYPAKNARHTAVSPDSVVFAGDSSGGNLCLALVQVILRIRSIFGGNEISFNGRRIEVPMPAGVAVLSPYLDLSRTFPSDLQNKGIDYLRDMVPPLQPDHIPDDVWPSKPPRGDPYCHPSAWIHPLVCPSVAKSWTGSPPIWIAVGEERLADSSKFLATEAARQNVQVIFLEYMGMPHVFPMLLTKLPQSEQCYQEWANACVSFCEETVSSNKGTIIYMPGKERRAVNVRELLDMDLDEVKLGIKARADQQKPWVPLKTESVAKL